MMPRKSKNPAFMSTLRSVVAKTRARVLSARILAVPILKGKGAVASEQRRTEGRAKYDPKEIHIEGLFRGQSATPSTQVLQPRDHTLDNNERGFVTSTSYFSGTTLAAIDSWHNDSSSTSYRSRPTTAVTITNEMSAAEILEQLVHHGCRDVTDQLEISQPNEYPASSGGFGDVYRATSRDGSIVAIKCPRLHTGSTLMQPEELKASDHAAHELYVWSKCRHSNVLRLTGVARYRNQIAMVSPWMKYGSLQDLMSHHPQVDRYKLCSQISDGVAYLHSVGLIHGDIKGTNILFSHELVPKLADFGSANFLKEHSLKFSTGTSEVATSLRWAAPEILEGGVRCTAKSDVYSLGMTILEVITGSVPYAGMCDPAIVAKVTKKVYPTRPEEFISTGDKYADLTWSLLVRCWAYDPQDRPDSDDVRNTMSRIALESKLGSYTHQAVERRKRIRSTATTWLPHKNAKLPA